MYEKLMTLPMTELRLLAQDAGLTHVSALRKKQLVEKICEMYEQKKAESAPAPSVQENVSASAVSPAPAEEVSSPAAAAPIREIPSPAQAAPAKETAEHEVPAAAEPDSAPAVPAAEETSPAPAQDNNRRRQNDNRRNNRRQQRDNSENRSRENNDNRNRENNNENRRRDNTENRNRESDENRNRENNENRNRENSSNNNNNENRNRNNRDNRSRDHRGNNENPDRRVQKNSLRMRRISRPENSEMTAENSATAAETSESVAPASATVSASASAVVSAVTSAPASVSAPAPEPQEAPAQNQEEPAIDLSRGEVVSGILELIPEKGFGFLRGDNFLSDENDVYIAHAQIRRFNLKTGDVVTGIKRPDSPTDHSNALMYIQSVNDLPPVEAQRRMDFEDMTPIFPNERLVLEQPGCGIAMRVMDLISPIGKGQRGMIVSQPKAGKTTLLKQIASSITKSHPEMYLIILLIDERPEEVTDIKESITGPRVEVIHSTFDELPEHHKKVSEMVLERAKRLVEQKQDVMILLDSITRLTRAYNLTVQPSGRTLSGGLDPSALNPPKKFFGAARNMREGGSLTILATALVDTGSRMDDVVFEEFKGTGNMELVLNRKLQEKRIFPAIDIVKSGTRRDDLLLTKEEQEVCDIIHRITSGAKPEEGIERVLDMFSHTKSNKEFLVLMRKNQLF